MKIFFLLLLSGFILFYIYLYRENFTGFAALPGAATTECSMQCRVQNGAYVDAENCCLCRTNNGYITGPRNSENPEFRKCMCSLGSGYESYCYKLATNFLLSQ